MLTNLYEANYIRIKNLYGVDSIMEIPFEDAVKNTDNIIHTMSKFLDSNADFSLYKKIKKREILPRISSYIDPKDKRLKNKKNEVVELEKCVMSEKLKHIKHNVQRKYYDELIDLIDSYEKKWF